MNTGIKVWATSYTNWLKTSPQGIRASQSPKYVDLIFVDADTHHVVYSNHGTFYYNQLASLSILSGDLQGAKESLQAYFGNQFQKSDCSRRQSGRQSFLHSDRVISSVTKLDSPENKRERGLFTMAVSTWKR